jgi:hypothetical protein
MEHYTLLKCFTASEYVGGAEYEIKYLFNYIFVKNLQSEGR